MESNPLFIKWFVSCVQSGKRAEEVLQNSQVFLDYCLRNVIEFLSEDARLVAKAMIAVAGPHTQAVLSYLTRLEGERLQIALQQLMVANVVTLVGQPGGSGIASAYDLAELPRRYLLKTYAPTPDEIISFSTQRNKLARTLEFVNAQSTASPYSPNTEIIRSSDDVVVAKYLLDALSAVRQKKGPEAIAFLTSAKTLAPTYAEVYRVEGWAHFFSGNYAAAKQAYETALELEPKSAALRYWYAGFLMRGYNDAESAASELKIAQELDPTSPDVRVEYSRALSYQFKFAEADEQLTPVIETDAGSTKLMRIAYDAWIQIAIRRAKFISTNFNYLAALEALEEVIRRFDSVPKSYLDRKILASVAQCTRLAQAIAFQLDQSNESNRAASLADKFGDVSKSITQYAARFGSQESVPKHIPVGGEAVGTIEDINPLGTFGFINVAGGGRLYFKGKEVDRTTVSRPLRVGDQLKFIVGMGDRGRIAERIEVVRQPSDDLCDDVGEIVSIASDFSSGVIRARDGEEYFFPRTELRSPKHMSYLEPGCPVRFVRGAGAAHSEGKERRPTAFSIEQQCSSLLNDALSDGRRLSAPIRWLRKRDAIARTPGGEVLVHPEQFCDRADWYDLKEGDIITFGVGLSEGQKFFGREIRLEKTR